MLCFLVGSLAVSHKMASLHASNTVKSSEVIINESKSNSVTVMNLLVFLDDRDLMQFIVYIRRHRETVIVFYTTLIASRTCIE